MTSRVPLRHGPTAQVHDIPMIARTPDRRDLRLIFRIAALAFAVVVAWFAFRPAMEVEGGLPWDKANHAVAFLILTILTGLGWPRLPTAFLFALMMVAGVMMEVVQGLPAIGRDADVMDVVADGVGTLIGLAALWVLSRRSARL